MIYLLANTGEAPGFAALVDRFCDPVDSWVATDLRVDESINKIG